MENASACSHFTFAVNGDCAQFVLSADRSLGHQIEAVRGGCLPARIGATS